MDIIVLKIPFFHVPVTNGIIVPTVIMIPPTTGITPGTAVILLTIWSTGMVFLVPIVIGMKNINAPNSEYAKSFTVSIVFLFISFLPKLYKNIPKSQCLGINCQNSYYLYIPSGPKVTLSAGSHHSGTLIESVVHLPLPLATSLAVW